MNPFVEVPYDVLQKVLCPYLDMDSMINFNRVVDHRDRVYRRLPKDYAIRHQLRLSSIKWHKMFDKFETIDDRNMKCKILYRVFKDIIRPINRVFIWHNSKFRETYINKFYEFQDPSNDVYGEETSKTWKKSYVALANRAVEHFNANPFKYPIKSFPVKAEMLD